jgi:hypothetical protein
VDHEDLVADEEQADEEGERGCQIVVRLLGALGENSWCGLDIGADEW